MSDKTVFEGRAELNIQPFLEGLQQMEAQAGLTAKNLEKVFRTLDQTLVSTMTAMQKNLSSVATQVNAIGRQVDTANRTIAQGNQLLHNGQKPAQEQQRAAQLAAQATRLQAEARTVSNQRELTELQRHLKTIELALDRNLKQQLDTARRAGDLRFIELQRQQERERALLERNLREQQEVRARQLSLAAQARTDQAAAIRGGRSGADEEARYDAAIRAAQRAAAIEASLKRQLSQVDAAERQRQTLTARNAYEAQQRAIAATGGPLQALAARIELVRVNLKRLEDQWN